MHPAHPLRVAAGQVRVHGDQVHALALQGVQVDGHGRGERLALAGSHLCDVALVQSGPPEDLDVIGPLAEDPLGGLADRCEGLGEKVVKGLPVCQSLLELGGLVPQGLVRERGDVVLVGVHTMDERPQFLDVPALAEAQQLLQDHWGKCRSGRPYLISNSLVRTA